MSFIATVGAVYFGMLIYQRVTVSKTDKLNIWTILVLASLAWWNLCDAFFYVARTKEVAWFWHQLGAPGWCGFIAITAWYFMVMMNADQKLKTPIKIVLWLPPLFLVLRFLLARPTAFAEDLVQSTSGLGWTYVQRYQTVWPFVFLAYLVLYMGGALFCLYRWQKRVQSRSRRRLAKGFIVLDSFVVALGFVSIFVLPYFTSYFPPAGCIATLIFGIWYWGWLRDYDFLHVELALNPGYLLESCIDAMVVMDEECLLLYVNTEAQKLLGVDWREGAGFLDYLVPESRGQLEEFLNSGSSKSPPLNLELQNGFPVICSVSRLVSRKRGLNVCILCMNEVSELKNTQRRLDYLAHYDDLTGLYNRRCLRRVLEEWADRARSGGDDFELLFLDLSGFKRINDTFGHKAGDAALVAVARAMRAVMEPADVLSRLAGDEFVVMHKADGRDVEALLYRAVQSIDSSLFAPGMEIDVDIGKCLFSEAEDVEILLQYADARMYGRKQARKN